MIRIIHQTDILIPGGLVSSKMVLTPFFSGIKTGEWRDGTNTGPVKHPEHMSSLGYFSVVFLMPGGGQTASLTPCSQPLSFPSSDCHVAWVSAQARNETVARRLWDVSCDLLGIPVDWLMMAAGPKRSLKQTTQHSLPKWFSFRMARTWSAKQTFQPCLLDARWKPSVHCRIHPNTLHLSRLLCSYYCPLLEIM